MFINRPATMSSRRVATVVVHSLSYSVLLLAMQAAFAQSKVEPVVVTALRAPEALKETLRDVSVVRGEDLVAAGVTDIVTALQSVPGIEVQSLGANATPSIFVRGGNSNQVLVLIDGQRAGSTYSGLTSLQHLAIGDIDRIEIVRGPAASLYGADAVSGVIQIFTKRSTGLSANVAFGDKRSSDVSARAGFANERGAFSLSGNHRESRGYNVIVDPKNFSYNPDRDGYRFSSIAANGSYKLMPQLTLEADVMSVRGNVQYDGGAKMDDHIVSELRTAAIKARYAPTDRWSAAFTVAQSNDESEFVSSFPSEFKTRQDQVSWQNNFRATRDISLWNVIEWRRERIDDGNDFAITSRKTTSVAAGADAQWNALKLGASLRVDDSNQYDTRATGHLGAAYSFTPEWRALANFGTSFKAPTFNDLYYPGFSNPTLAPEKAKNIDVGVQWASGASNAKLMVYENRVRDLIQFQCDANFVCLPLNVAKADLRGATLSFGTQLSGWSIDASLDAADPEDVNTGKRLARRAKHHGALKLSGNLLGVTTGLEVVGSGNRFDNASNTRRLAGYGVVNLFARYTVMRGVTVGARLENAADREYEFSRGYATGGRRVWLNVSLHQPG